MTDHVWVPSTLGHGDLMCKHCCGTSAELRAIGRLDHCKHAPEPAQPLPEGVDLREQVARIIDPWAFQTDEGDPFQFRRPAHQKRALAKADAILALPELRALRLPGAHDGWVMVPREPTPDQMEAWRQCTIRNSRKADPAWPFESPYTCAVLAAPSPPKDEAPTHTDLMVTPESIGPYLAQVEAAKLICDFMNWPEDGPAWDDANKLARSVLGSCCASAKACVSAAPPQSEVPSAWRAIETAPKDGTVILALEVHRNPTYRPRIYEGNYEAGSQLGSLLSGEAGPRFHNKSANRWDRPTHWMPLPPTPDTGSSGIAKTKGSEDE